MGVLEKSLGWHESRRLPEGGVVCAEPGRRGWKKEIGRDGLTEETFCSLLENLSLDPRWAGSWRGAPLSGGPGGAGQACFQGYLGSDFNMAHAVTLTPP